MIITESKLESFFKKSLELPIYYFYSTEIYLIEKATKLFLTKTEKESSEAPTVIAGSAPDLQEITLAAGSISFLGTKRIIHIPLFEITAFSAKDLKEFFNIVQDTENAIFFITTLFEDVKAISAKQSKSFIEKVSTLGEAIEIAPLGHKELIHFLIQQAKDLDTILEPQAAEDLFQRCGEDLLLLTAEIQKLAASCNYTTITSTLVAEMGVRNVETDVFEMIQMLQYGKKEKAFFLLQQLFLQNSEPISISAALSASYIDIYRVKVAQKAGKNFSYVHKDFAYKGSDWRLKKANQIASKLSLEQLKQILEVLLDLDTNLKSSPLEKQILLQTALAEIMMIGSRR